MTSRTNKELSRRDALKLLGAAAGASVLANLPSKWSTPRLTAGVLPAHAATSAVCLDDSLVIEWLSAANTLYQQDGNWSTGDGQTTDTKRWPCNQECDWYWVQANDEDPGATIRVKTWRDPAFDVFIQAGWYYWIYLDTLSGNINQGHVDPQDWPETIQPPDGSGCDPIFPGIV